ncbi:beta-d-glucosyl crocetin beta-1 6-glucosyltransferase [Phtheirospermum japonicum]|uniref:Glycosyltransferase n=1 Tax=Phtheirospermum japonicum TaxID=374723 RepID=A0A830D3N4_9LAMI|nr:beta-d-glucosyl crocetin beta-1 6-glucosyltransferase [Phtheirospermum japonicum]
MDPQQTSFKALMFPWLAHGHIFPFLELAKKLSNTKSFHIYFCSTSINLDSVRKSLNEQLVELHLPSLPELPPHYHTTKNIPPHLMPTLMQAFQMSSPNFSDIIADLKPDLLIYDGFQPWSVKIASSLNIPSVLFATSASASLSFFHHQYTHKSFDTYPYPEIFLREHEKRDLLGLGGSIEVKDTDEGLVFGIFELSRDIVLIKSCRGIENKYMNYLSDLCGRKIVPTGPLITNANNNQQSVASLKIMDWLNKKSPFSTLYISFGSENYLSGEQMREIAKGLELSHVNFIWIVRSPVGSDINSVDENLPREFLDSASRTNRGMVLREWAPQAEILAHPSVGGFMSHCGWSSVTESVYFGVPILGAPLKLDQPANCRAAVEAGVCVEVMRGESGEFDGEEVAKAISEVILSESGKRFRFKARELSKEMKMEEEDGFCEVTEELRRVCAKKIDE